YTTSINLAGIPSISIPIGKDSNNLPIGLQIISNQFEEKKLFQMANFILNESST
ncbi:MAG: Asp-tRNA(Asn)/Glu-tRNA(Gln) amidotransferase subunit GatA, partial [Ignavibacteriaceae bacterium]|nr:Asp-tRNA(Asn)/Glu-tRNA(Gln) amidotransferase subunit GatA [Ignavibacteriaceae bacterium]